MKPASRIPKIDLEDLLTYRISTLYSQLSAGVAKELAGQFGLVLREWRVMAMLARLDATPASALVARSPMDKASVSRAVASLARKRLLRAFPSPQDARVKMLQLTPSGWTLYARVAPRSLARQKALLSVLTAAERESLMSMLSRLETQVARHFGAASA
jgi:DNA-binding MarR family transcriptional regulator